MERPSFEQKAAWRSSLRYLGGLLRQHPNFNGLLLLLEYKLPFSGERIDAVLLGTNRTGKPTALVIEMKGWKTAELYSQDFVMADSSPQIHPEYQLRNYLGKLAYSHSAAAIFDFRGMVLMYNMKRNDSRISFRVPCFYEGEERDATEFIESNVLPSISQEAANGFVNGKYLQSKKLFEAVREHFSEIWKESYTTLADRGYGLSIEQLQIVKEILGDLDKGRRIVYLVKGAPGSGKTLVAIHLLLSSLYRNKQSVLTYRNNRLLNSLRKVFNKNREGLDVPIRFYSTGQKSNPGIAEPGFEGFFDLVIYDEAQRMRSDNISLAMTRGKVQVFFYDESQILNAEESGTTDNFIKAANQQNLNTKSRELAGYYRVLGGKEYHEWLESLLSEPAKAKMALPWQGNYEFRIVGSISELLGVLEDRRDGILNNKVGLIASFTESPGDKNQGSTKNTRIGATLPSGLDLYEDFRGTIKWLMDPKRDYVPFWVNGRCNELKECASIYGCQGFEIDYAGIVWGRDLVFRKEHWEVGSNCEDSIGRPVSLKKLFQRAKAGDEEANELAVRLLINRYRIFLTRGIKGTFVLCEDQQTAQLLRHLVPLLHLA